jgi:hypothetical protein
MPKVNPLVRAARCRLAYWFRDSYHLILPEVFYELLVKQARGSKWRQSVSVFPPAAREPGHSNSARFIFHPASKLAMLDQRMPPQGEDISANKKGSKAFRVLEISAG